MNLTDYKKYEPIWGKWYLTQQIGKGAFGTVFEAETRDIGKMKSALKIVSIPSSSTEVDSYKEEHFGIDEKSVSSYFYGFVEEFLKEIGIMAELKGKSNIVSIEDFEVIEHTENIGWDILIRMELLTSLNKYFAGKPITEKDVVKLGVDICRALAECEKQNIIHRDIKPSNIFVSDSGEYKLGDFGVARTLEKTSSGLSKKGTYTYMAPEVYKGEDDYTSNVDTYSLGIVMYKLLNNNFEPFRTELTPIDEENALKNRMIGSAISAPANASDEVSKIILKACSYNPCDRYSSPLQMMRELEKIYRTEENKFETESEETEKQEKEEMQSPVPQICEMDDEETVGLFGERNITSDKTIDVENCEETSQQHKKEYYEVKLIRTKYLDNKIRGIDVYIDDKFVAENVLEPSYELKVSSGKHLLRLKLHQLGKGLEIIDKGNKFFGFGMVSDELKVEVDCEAFVKYRVNTATGGIEFVNGAEKKKKNKVIALLLAAFPYTGIFGGYHFYIGDGKGIPRLCTLNFLTIGYFIDIITAVIDLFKKDE